MSYARVAFVTWLALDALAIISFPFCVLLAALAAHLLTRSIPSCQISKSFKKAGS